MAGHDHHNHCCSSRKPDPQDERVFQEQLDAAGKSLTRALQLSFNILKLIMVAVVVLFLLSGIIQIQPDEQALLLRFGQIKGDGEDALLKPGIIFSWPSPIDEIVRIPVETVQTLQIDSFWYYQTPAEKLNPELKRTVTGPLDPVQDGYSLTSNESLTGTQGTDYNIVHSKWSVTYKIGSPALFFKNMFVRDRNPGEDFLDAASETVEPILESLVSDAIVNTMLHYDIDRAIKSEESIASKVEDLLQEKLDKVESGITIDAVRADEIVWPRQVDAAFQDSTKARQESEQMRVDARAYKEKLMTDTGGPQAEEILEKLKQTDLTQDQQEKLVAGLSGQVQTTISEARAYRTTVVSNAKADAEYLQQLLPKYREYPDLVLQGIYQDAVTQVLANADEKFIMQRTEDGKPVEFRFLLNRDPDVQKQQAKENKQEN
ncbi:MAG: protease modulator HflK [Planctomycetota bacterium]|jgi:membrane protease subunit HflK